MKHISEVLKDVVAHILSQQREQHGTEKVPELAVDRLVACVQACDGISTEALQRGGIQDIITVARLAATELQCVKEGRIDPRSVAEVLELVHRTLFRVADTRTRPS